MRLALALVVLSACADGPAPSAGGPADPPPAGSPGAGAPDAPDRLTGSEWDLIEIDGRPTLDRTFPTLSFVPPPPGVPAEPGAGQMSGYDGCNNFGVRYRLDGDQIAADELVSELQGCLPAVMDQADAYTAALVAAARVRWDDDRLVVSDSLGAEALVFRRHAERSVDAAALTRGRWRLASVEALPPPPGPPMPPPPPVPPPPPPPYPLPPPEPPPPPLDPDALPPEVVVSFGADGVVRGTAGCRTLAGTYRLSGDDLSLPSFGVNDAACSPSERTRAVDYGLTSGEVEVSDRRLILYTRGGGRVTFVRL